MSYREQDHPHEYFEEETGPMDGRILSAMKTILTPFWRILLMPVFGVAWILVVLSFFLVPFLLVLGFVCSGNWVKFVREDEDELPYLVGPKDVIKFYRWSLGK